MTVYILAEHRRGELMDVTFESISAARRLNDEVVAILLGTDLADHAEKVAKYADKVLVVEDERIENNTEAYTQVIGEIIKKDKPKVFLMGNTSMGMDIAPALAIDLDSPIATDVVGISEEGGRIKVNRSVYNGKVLSDLVLREAETSVIAIRSGEFSAADLEEKNGEITKVDSPLKEAIENKKFLEFVEPVAGAVDITQADVLISVGRGIKDKDNLPMAEELADAVGGVVSCSRPVVDYDWLPKDRQVGTSGKTVKPKFYLAFGISGAFQHVAGMKGATMIVAINKDIKAPIFSVAQYGIVDDLLKVMPALTEKIKELKS